MDLNEMRVRVAILRDTANENPSDVEAQSAANVAHAFLYDAEKERSAQLMVSGP